MNYKNNPSHDYDQEMKYQQEFLNKQETEMGVAKNALEKYPTMGWIPTIVLALSSLLGWAVTLYYVADSVVSNKNTATEHVLPLTTTPESLQGVLKIDTMKLIEDHKETLDSTEREKFEQLSPQKQWDHVHKNH